jgi:transposase
MNDMQKAKIQELRLQGAGYRKIAKEMGLSENTVKSYCHRHPQTEQKTDSEHIHYCLQCNKTIEQNSKRKEKKFCSDTCRMAWWNSHRDKVKHRIVHQMECAYCHKTFTVYGNGQRKYCSHTCYVADRFGGEKHGSEAIE